MTAISTRSSGEFSITSTVVIGGLLLAKYCRIPRCRRPGPPAWSDTPSPSARCRCLPLVRGARPDPRGAQFRRGGRRAIGSDLHTDYTAVGQTTHPGARMEQMGTPSTIKLAQTTLQLAEEI